LSTDAENLQELKEQVTETEVNSEVAFLRQDAMARLEWRKVTQFLADFAVFPSTQERLSELLPWLPPEERLMLFDGTEEMLRVIEAGKEVPLTEINFESFEKPLQREAILTAQPLFQIYLLCRAMREGKDFAVKAVREKAPYPLVIGLLQQLSPLPSLEIALARSVDSEGKILSTASPELQLARSRAESARKRIVESLENLLRRPGVRDALQDSVWMLRDGRYVLPVRSDCRNDIQGVPHGVSASGSTLFVEPTQIAEAQSAYEQAQTEVQIEEARVLRSLSESAAMVRDLLFDAIDILGSYDEYRARSRFAKTVEGVRPRFHNPDQKGPRFVFDQAKHPLFLLENKPCIPNDLALERVREDGTYPTIWVITGPNAGGKTVAMRTVGLLTLMALGGLFVSARSASLVEFEDVFVELGDRQSREEDLSTFSGHLLHVKRMVEHASSRTLLLLDEGFVGTDPTVGMALARATLEYFAEKESTVIITTHFSNLKTLADSDGHFENASMEFESRELRPTYRILNGLPGQSYALELATRLGFESTVIVKAKQYCGEESARMEKLLQDLQEKRSLLNDELEHQKSLRIGLEQELKRIQTDQEHLLSIRNTLFDDYRQRLQKKLNSFENKLAIRERQFERQKDSELREITKEKDIRFAHTQEPHASEQPQPEKHITYSKAPPPSENDAKNLRAKPKTLSDFSALAQVNIPKEKSSKKSSQSNFDIDEKEEAFRPSKQFNSRSLLDEARESIREMQTSFDVEETSFKQETNVLLELESKLNKETVTSVSKAKEETASHPASFWKEGMRVKSAKFKEILEIIKGADSKGLVECRTGLIKVKIHHSELVTIAGAANQKEPVKTHPAVRNESKKAPKPPTRTAKEFLNSEIPATFQHKGNTCDLRGLLVHTALDRLGEYLDRAWRTDTGRIIIIHGHGTGKVKLAVREALVTSGYDLTYRPGTQGEGGDGATVVQFES
jgi:DNA mismatch repair protein MutS2